VTYGVTSSSALEQPAGTLWWVLGVFLGLPAACVICILGRALRDFLRQRRLDRLEAESLRDEGYPPPGPPTT